jgi:hypothetical protein
MAEKNTAPPAPPASSSTSTPETESKGETKPARERPPGTRPLSEHFAAVRPPLEAWQRAAILARRELLVPPTPTDEDPHPKQQHVDENTDVTLVNFRKAMEVALHGGA